MRRGRKREEKLFVSRYFSTKRLDLTFSLKIKNNPTVVYGRSACDGRR